MRDVFDIYTIIFLALAVFIFLRLRSVLGQRTGRERPPYDPYAAREPSRPAPDKVVALPNRAPEAAAAKPAEPAAPPGERWKGIAELGTPLAAGLDTIVGADPNFDAKHFLTGARAAYEMIVNAFAEGDRRTLEESVVARGLRRLRVRHLRAREARRDHGEPFRLHRQRRNHRRRIARPRRAVDRAFPVASS